MIPEYLLLNILLYKSCFLAYKDDVDLKKLKEEYRELGYLFQAVYDLHQQVPTDLSVDDVAAFFWAKYPDSSRDVYQPLIDKIKAVIITPESASAVVAEYKSRALALRVSDAAMKVALNGGDLTSVKELLSSSTANSGADDLGVELVSDDLESLIGEKYGKPGYRWRLDCLNKSLGSLRQGDFGFIFARPEAGKTTFLASECSQFLAGSNRPVVWFNNEEDGAKVKLRFIQAWFGIPSAQILSNLKKYQDQFLKETDGRFLLFDGASIHRRSVERVVNRYNPGLVVYDQLTKIQGFNADRPDLELGAKFQWARELAKNNHAAIGVSQADGTAEGVRYLGMEHIANAKTSVQAEADFILGIGDPRDGEDIRYLAISKNKLMGDKDSKEELRHGRFECLILPTIARYKDIIKYD